MGVIFFFGIFSIFTKDRKSSVLENRPLAQSPSFSKKDLGNGKYFGELTNYTSDQLFFRDNLVKAYQRQMLSPLFNANFISKLVEKKGTSKNNTGTIVKSAQIINNRILVNHEWILGKLDDHVNTTPIVNNAKKIDDIARIASQYGTEVDLIFNPYKGLALKHLFPVTMQFDAPWQEKQLFVSKLSSSIHVVDTANMLKNYTNKQIENMYFKTDHHWNMSGAFLSYQYAVSNLSKVSTVFHEKPVSMNDIQVVKLNGTFQGSLNHQIGNVVDPKVETTLEYLPKDGFHFSSFHMVTGDGVPSNDFQQYYATGAHHANYDYGGAYAPDEQEIFIQNNHADNQLKVLMIKDSYADPTIPFYAQNIYQLTVMDNRYMQHFDLAKLLKDHHYDMLIFEFNDTNLVSHNYDFKK